MQPVLSGAWRRVLLGDLVTQGTERVMPQSVPQELYLGLDGIEKNTSRIIKVVRAQDMKSSAVRFMDGDVLYGRMRPYLNKVTVAPFDGLASGEIIVLKVSETVTPDFLRLRMMSGDFLDFIAQCGKGDRPRVSFGDISGFEFDLPPRPMQESIVREINYFHSKTSEIRRRLNKLPELVFAAKASLLRQALSGGATSDWRIQASRHDSSLAQVHETTFHRREGTGNASNVPPLPFETPASWTWSTFQDESEEITVGHVGAMKNRYVGAEGIPFLRSMNVRPNRIELDGITHIDAEFHAELSKSQLKPGNLVVVRTGAPGTAAVIPNTIPEANCSDLIILRLLPHVNAYFAAYYINSEFVQNVIKSKMVGIAQQHFNIGSIKKVPIPIPPIEEQALIVDYLDGLFSVLDEAHRQYMQSCELLDMADSSMLFMALNDDLRISVPNDAVGEVLHWDGTVMGENTYTMQSENEKPLLNSESKKKKVMPRDAIRNAIEAGPSQGLSFSEIRAQVDVSYDILRDALFDMLSPPNATISQSFDSNRALMLFRKIA